MIHKRDLKQGQSYASLYCSFCDIAYSADSGDYWYMQDDDPIGPCDCGEEFILARKEVAWIPLRGTNENHE